MPCGKMRATSDAPSCESMEAAFVAPLPHASGNGVFHVWFRYVDTGSFQVLSDERSS
jgi:hypothetical protein